VAVGRLVEQKGFDLLLKAFSIVAEQCRDWNLVIWGEGPERAKLERLRDELGLRNRVRLPGLTPEPYGWIDGAHLFVLSSRFEGLGNVVGEAMAAGLPVIAFDCDWGPREFVKPDVNGILVPPQDVEALAKAIVMLIRNDTLRDELAVNARASMGRFSPEGILAQWDGIVRDAVYGSGYNGLPHLVGSTTQVNLDHKAGPYADEEAQA
jgi:glycosyltransferase involved in cell wall biosynthesis